MNQSSLQENPSLERPSSTDRAGLFARVGCSAWLGDAEAACIASSASKTPLAAALARNWWNTFTSMTPPFFLNLTTALQTDR